MHAKSSGCTFGQYGNVTVYAATSTNSKTPMYMLGTSKILIPVGTMYHFRLLGSGIDTTTGNTYIIGAHGMIKNVAGTTTLIVNGTDYSNNDLGGGSITVEANDSTDSLDVFANGKTTTNIRWTAFVEWVEIIIT